MIRRSLRLKRLTFPGFVARQSRRSVYLLLRDREGMATTWQVYLDADISVRPVLMRRFCSAHTRRRVRVRVEFWLTTAMRRQPHNYLIVADTSSTCKCLSSHLLNTFPFDRTTKKSSRLP
jgi:hypothetical protein